MEGTGRIKGGSGAVSKALDRAPALSEREAEVVVGEVVDGGLYQGDGELLLLAEQPPRDRHPALVYLASLSPGSRRTMRASLENIAAFVSGGRANASTLAWHELRYQHTALIRATLAETYAPATANKMLSALRGVLKECFRLGYMGAEEYQRARDLPPVRGSALPKGRALSHGELRRLFEVCAEDLKRARGARDAAVLSVLYGCGLRRSEAVDLNLSDFDHETEELRVRGKGGKERIVYAAGGAAEALGAWISLRGQEDGPLFYPVNKGGRIERRRMSDQAVLYVLKRRGQQIAAKGFSPHDMRRTFIGDLLDAGADLAAVQKLAGHANVQTTARYDRRGERAKTPVKADPCRYCGSLAWSCVGCGAPAAGFGANVAPGKGAGDTVKRGRTLTAGELSALLAVCLWKGTAGGVRDAAMIAVLCVAGLRRGELSELELGDLREEPLTLSIRTREGRPDRGVVLDGAAADILMSWVALRGDGPGRLFLPMDHTGTRVSGKLVPPRNVSAMLSRRSTRAGIEPVKVADLHASSLKALLSGREVVPVEENDLSTASPVAPTAVPPQLVAAARALAAWRPPEPGGAGPLDELATDELERLGRRIDGIMMRRTALGGTGEVGDEEGTRADLWRSVYRALAGGTPKHEVARLFKQDISAVNRRTHVAGLMDGAQVGRMLMTTQAKRVLESDLGERPFATALQRSERLAETCGVRVSESTVIKHIRSLGYTRIAGRYVRPSENSS